MSPNRSMCDALLARGPAPELANDNTFGWLVGSWNVEVHDFESDGARRVSNGEWHFAWVLGGRAIQDVFVVPRRDERSIGRMPANRYGTTLRIYDLVSSVWRLVWVDPARNDLDVLTTWRDAADNIVQEGTDAGGSRFRWTFTAIAADAFTFVAEAANAAPAAWKQLAEFTAARQAT